MGGSVLVETGAGGVAERAGQGAPVPMQTLYDQGMAGAKTGGKLCCGKWYGQARACPYCRYCWYKEMLHVVLRARVLQMKCTAVDFQQAQAANAPCHHCHRSPIGAAGAGLQAQALGRWAGADHRHRLLQLRHVAARI